jgi:hypothetical protein
MHTVYVVYASWIVLKIIFGYGISVQPFWRVFHENSSRGRGVVGKELFSTINCYVANMLLFLSSIKPM